MMIKVSQAPGKVQVTVLSIQGNLDGSNYLDVVASARAAYDAGALCFLIDMSDMPFMASSGLVALHSIALILRGQPVPDPESGWEAFRSVRRDLDSGRQGSIKLLNPQPRVRKLLEMSGFVRLMEVYTDLDAAVASFAERD